MAVENARDAWKTKFGNSTAKNVFILLVDQANADGYGWPGIHFMADRTEVSERTVRRLLQVFIEIGLLARVTKKARGWEYQITMEKLGKDLTAEFAAAYGAAQCKQIHLAEMCRRDTSGDVAETLFNVAETPKSVAATIPPHPLYGVPAIDPLKTQTPLPPAMQGGELEDLEAFVAEATAEAEERFKGITDEAERKMSIENRRWAATCAWEEHQKERKAEAVKAAEAARLLALYPSAEAAAKGVMRGCGFSPTATRLEREIAEVIRMRAAEKKSFGATAEAMVAAWNYQQSQGTCLRVKYGPKKFFALGVWLNPDGWMWDAAEIERARGARIGSER